MGVSLWRLILSISLTAFVIGSLDLIAFNPLSSVMLERYEKLEKKYFLSGITEDVKVESTGLWLSEKNGA